MTFLKFTLATSLIQKLAPSVQEKLPPNEKVQEFEPGKGPLVVPSILYPFSVKDVMFSHDFSVTSPFTMRLDVAFFNIALPHLFNFIENLSISPVLLKQLKFLISHSIQFTMQKNCC